MNGNEGRYGNGSDDCKVNDDSGITDKFGEGKKWEKDM